MYYNIYSSPDNPVTIDSFITVWTYNDSGDQSNLLNQTDYARVIDMFPEPLRTGMEHPLHLPYVKSVLDIPATTSDLTEGSNLYWTSLRFDSDFSGKTTSNLTEGSNQYFTISRARSSVSNGAGIGYNTGTGVFTNTAPDQTVSLSNGTGISVTGTYPNFTITNSSPYTNPTFNDNVSRSLSNASGSTNQFTISSTQNARVYYSLQVSWSITALLSTASTILLEYSTNGGSNWKISNRVSKNVNLGLIQSGLDDLNISGDIPANALVRIRPSVSTNSTITYLTGHETLY